MTSTVANGLPDRGSYRLFSGRVFLDWAHRPVLFHRQGCPLCCTVRVTGPNGGKPRHPRDCFNCGPSWERRRPDPCALCGRTAHFRDDDGRPVHKTCLKEALTQALSGGPGRAAA
ncbi:hypothetical protein [Actinomadura verrucosospora]|uniref:hypothetical protein n=1 Tax=Actinomadura verrucosospora TaxID=46165 RepID=UPI0015645566|nr:hypothetical protein [Actinomadura verrucosospora]